MNIEIHPNNAGMAPRSLSSGSYRYSGREQHR